ASPLSQEHARALAIVDVIGTPSPDEVGRYSLRAYWQELNTRQAWLDQGKCLSVGGVTSSAAAVLMLMVAASSYLATRAVSARDVRRPVKWSLFWPMVLWSVIFGVTFGILGWVVSYQPRWREQNAGVQWSIVGVVAATVGWPAWLAARLIWRKRDVPRRERG